jgi:hypothetical protein
MIVEILWRRKDMLIDGQLLKRILLVLAAASGILAFNLSFENSERAAQGCGPYSPQFIFLDAFYDAILLFIPSFILLIAIFFTWIRYSFKFASTFVTLVYCGFVTHEYIQSAMTNYSPCDRKGDEQSLLVAIIGIFGMPMLWYAVMLIVEVIKYSWSLIMRLTRLK